MRKQTCMSAALVTYDQCLLPAALCMCLIGFAKCDAVLAVIFISLGVGFSGMVYSGSSLTQLDFAPQYSGIITAIANTFATIPGFVGPIVAGVFTENQADLSGWNTVFLICAGIAVFAAIFFLIFGTAKLQPWAKETDQNYCNNDQCLEQA